MKLIFDARISLKLIKLIFRFYNPDEGSIKLDNIDIKEYDVYKVRKVFGVLFQDYITYCLPLREIIALSEFDSVNDDNKLDSACNISGADEIINVAFMQMTEKIYQVVNGNSLDFLEHILKKQII